MNDFSFDLPPLLPLPSVPDPGGPALVAVSREVWEEYRRRQEMDRPHASFGSYLVGQALSFADPRSAFQKVVKLREYRKAGQDLVQAGWLLKDFGLSGAYRVVSHQGRKYIIFKGYAGWRQYVRGTRYLAGNPRIVGLALGSLGLKKVVREGVLSVVLVGAGLAADAVLAKVLGDEEALRQLNRSWRPELTKAALTGLASSAAAALAAGTGLVLWPLAASVVVGLVVGHALDYLESEHHIFERAFAAIDDHFRRAGPAIEAARRALPRNGLPLWEAPPPAAPGS